MLNQAFKNHIELQLADHVLQPVKIVSAQAIAGGCINDGYQLLTSAGLFFLKLNQAHLLEMFAAEAAGLVELQKAEQFVIPEPISYGLVDQQSYLLMSYLEFSGRVSEDTFGQSLRAMHTLTRSQFGFHSDNFIGSSPQSNRQHDKWFDFFMQERLEFQLRMLHDSGRGSELNTIWPEFVNVCQELFGSYKPKPSLLHGDLWQGNVGQVGAKASIFDPAVYYGDAEADLAMLTLFGSPSKRFYESYYSAVSESGADTDSDDANRALRRDWYNLYHVLNHANLFGGGYLNQAKAIIRQIICTRSQ